MTTTFENAQVGDKVYSLQYGWGEICKLHAIPGNLFPLEVNFKTTSWLFNIKGYPQDINALPCTRLFWKEPEIIAPEQPKRKKMRTFEGWLLIKGGINGAAHAHGSIFLSKESAEFDRIQANFGEEYKSVKFTTEEFEVEE